MREGQMVSAASAATGGETDVFLPGDAVRVEGNSAKLIGGKCRSCSLETFPRYDVCPGCMGEDVAESEMPGEGVIYSLSTVHVGAARWHKPFTLGYVDLPNGVRVFSHLTANCKIGDRVVVGLAEVGRERSGAAINSFVFRTSAR